jgi:hypothetical protein
MRYDHGVRARATLLFAPIALAGCSSILGIDGFSVGDGGVGSGGVDAAPSGILQRAYLKESDTATTDALGTAIASSADGNTLAVGADAEAGTGAVYIYTRSGTTWAQQAVVRAASGDIGDLFGHSVAMSADGNTLAIGADGEASGSNQINGNQTDNSSPASGAVYVFTRSGTSWAQTTYLKASNRDANDHFGAAVALAGDGLTLVAGAPQEASSTTGASPNTSNANDNAATAGAAYVFAFGGTTWTQQAYVKASNTGPGDLFGSSVALSTDGSTLVAGAIGESSAVRNVGGLQADNSATAAGAAYVFTRAATAWSQQVYLKASNTEAGDAFGAALALSGDGNTLVVGAPSEDSLTAPGDNNAQDSGAAYAFTRSGTAWATAGMLKAAAPAANDKFASAIALSIAGGSLVVGAHGAHGKGAADIFTRGTAFSLTAELTATNAGPNDSFGQSVAVGGTSTTQGFAVGAPGEDSMATGINGDGANNGATDSGAAYIFQ